jgi:uncharacterized protein (TIGR03790 family)
MLFWIQCQGALAQRPSNILLVLNESSPVSLEVGQYYAQKRGVPEGNILRIQTPIDDQIERADYERRIESPIATWLARNSAQDRILYIVLTKGIPLRIAGTSGLSGTIASVDSELTLLYRKMLGQQVIQAGPVVNPYYLGESPVANARKFTHADFDIYLVSRIDGYTFSDIQGLIDRGVAASREGKILLDGKGDGLAKGDNWLQAAAERLKEAGFGNRVVLDLSPKVLSNQSEVLGYYSWGSNDPAIRIRHLDLKFMPGALAGMYVSSDGRTFSEPPEVWKTGSSWDDKSSLYAGSPQSLAGDLIRDGVTGIAAHVAEPFLEATIHPNILFPAYLSGYNLIESFYLAMPYLSWQTIVVGDPLCAPFRDNPLSVMQIDKGIDEETGLPGFFSARRLRLAIVAAAKQPGTNLDATKLLLKAEVHMLKQDRVGAREALEQATDKDGRLTSAHLMLALLYEQAEEFDKAIDRYRRVLEVAPDNAIVLNNLAYALAVRKNLPQEALPFSEKAYANGKGNPNLADTLGWINHLLGKDDTAIKYLEEAAKGADTNAEIHFHSAVVYASLGQIETAQKELARALSLNQKLQDRADVQALQLKLKPKSTP